KRQQTFGQDTVESWISDQQPESVRRIFEATFNVATESRVLTETPLDRGQSREQIPQVWRWVDRDELHNVCGGFVIRWPVLGVVVLHGSTLSVSLNRRRAAD